MSSSENLAPYSQVHASPGGPGDARPSGTDIVKDQGLVGKLAGKVMLVTGCSPGGIGVETARALHVTGADVYMTARNLQTGQTVVDDIKSNGGHGKIELLKMELDSFQSIRAAVAEFLAKSKTLNVLVNNAGVMACPFSETTDGFERQFGTNHLGHFLLFQLLKPILLASSTAAFQSRLVSLSSSGHHNCRINFDDHSLRSLPNGYNPWAAYGQSKTANIYLANEVERRYGSLGLHANSVMPGGIETPLQKYQPHLIPEAKKNPESYKMMKSTAQGAATTVWAAVAKEWSDTGGKYLEDCAVAGLGKPETWSGHSEWAFDERDAKRLWTESCTMVGVDDD